jgi:hypothetical protein
VPPFPPQGPIVAFCAELVAHDLPELPADRRASVAAFAGRRIGGLPAPVRIGVGIVGLAVAGAGRLVGGARLAAFLARKPLPVVGDYVRLLRSLAFAFVWDRWPDTAPTGAPG